MKKQFKKAVVVALAAAMCIPTTSFGQDITTSFDVYSPVLTVKVTPNADIRINPIASSTATGVTKFSVASNNLDIINASVDADSDTAIPVNATIQATISSQKEDVISEYNTFTEDKTSTKKRIYLELAEAQTSASIGAKTGETLAFNEKKLNLDQFEVKTQAIYTTPAKKVPVTKYGSLLSLDIAGPTTTDSTAGATFSTDATKVTPTVKSFAVTGVANTNADWKLDDMTVAITYNVRASQALNITTPTVAAVTATGTSADVAITVPGVGEATVVAIAIHNNGEKMYGDYMLEDCKVEYKANTSATPSTTDAEITISKDHPTLAFLAEEANGCKGKAQDLVIGLSDGRRVVSTLTVN